MTTKPTIPEFRFHIPGSGKVIDYSELQKKIRKNPSIEEVDLINIETHMKMGRFQTTSILEKFA